MASHEWETDDRWVEERLATLEPHSAWVPSTAAALSRLQRRRRKPSGAAVRWALTATAAACLIAVMLVIPASRACAEQPGACVQRILRGMPVTGNSPAAPNAATLTNEPSTQAATPPVHHAVEAPPPQPPPTPASFQSVGSDSAPVTVEIYLDLDCPHCETFLREVIPPLTDAYIAPGRVKLLYRNFPLPTHPYAILAARYANTAGHLGYFVPTIRQLLATRQRWDQTGDIDTPLAQVLAPETMENIRCNLAHDSADSDLAADIASGQADHLDRTPFVVVVADGQRHPFTETLSFQSLKNRLDSMAPH